MVMETLLFKLRRAAASTGPENRRLLVDTLRAGKTLVRRLWEEVPEERRQEIWMQLTVDETVLLVEALPPLMDVRPEQSSGRVADYFEDVEELAEGNPEAYARMRIEAQSVLEKVLSANAAVPSDARQALSPPPEFPDGASHLAVPTATSASEQGLERRAGTATLPNPTPVGATTKAEREGMTGQSPSRRKEEPIAQETKESAKVRRISSRSWLGLPLAACVALPILLVVAHPFSGGESAQDSAGSQQQELHGDDTGQLRYIGLRSKVVQCLDGSWEYSPSGCAPGLSPANTDPPIDHLAKVAPGSVETRVYNQTPRGPLAIGTLLDGQGELIRGRFVGDDLFCGKAHTAPRLFELYERGNELAVTGTLCAKKDEVEVLADSLWDTGHLVQAAELRMTDTLGRPVLVNLRREPDISPAGILTKLAPGERLVLGGFREFEHNMFWYDARLPSGRQGVVSALLITKAP